MILRVKKRDLIIISATFVLLVLIPFVYAQTNTPLTAGFGVWIIISNENPVIQLNNVTFSADPSSGSSTEIIISFNVTDGNGVSTINGSTAIVNLTLGEGETADGQWRDNVSSYGDLELGSCYNHSQGTTMIVNCTIMMRYYDNASTWNITAIIQDIAGGSARNDTVQFTYNSLAAFSITVRDLSEGANINFTSLSLGATDQQNKAPLLLNNTGNNDFDMINITAASLFGLSDSSESIGPSNFAVNGTNVTSLPGYGVALALSAVTIRQYEQSASDSLDNLTLWHGPGISGDTVPYTGFTYTKGNQTLIFWVDVPSSGLSTQTYNNTWNLTVIDID